MRLAAAARRTLAVGAVSALLAGGSVVTGVALGVANAASETVNPSPSAETNDGVKTFTVTTTANADQFRPDNFVTVTLTRQGAAFGQDPITGTPVDNGDCNIPMANLPNENCGRTLSFTADLTNVAPGTYTVTINNPASSPTGTAETYTGNIGVAVALPPSVSSSKLYTGTVLPPDGKLELSGAYLTKGTLVDFLLADKTTVDPGLTFVATVDGGTAGNGYVSSTVLRGTYTQSSSFTAGPHYLRVTNPIAQSTVSASAFFFQPRVSLIDPSTLGQGATTVPLTITGSGFDPTSSLFVKEAGTATGSAAGISIGDVGVSSGGDSITTTISVGAATATGTRDLTVRGSKGGFFKVPNGLTITASPKPTSVSPNNRGQGFIGDVTITGTGFNAGTTFDFGDGIGLLPSKSSTGGTTNVVTMTIAPNAQLGARNIVARNTDYGTSTLASGFTVNALPTIDKLSPASALRGESKTVDVLGKNFVSGATLTSTPAGLTISNVQFVSANQLRATFQVAPNAAAEIAAFDVRVTNPDGGTSTLPGAYGVNSVSVLTTPVANASSVDVTIQAPGLAPSSTVAVRLPSATDQGQLLGSYVGQDVAQNRVTFSLPLTKAAAGLYTLTATTTTGSTLTCTGCLNVVAAFTPNSLVVTPSVGGAGATSRAVKITSSNANGAQQSGLSRGQTVSFGAGTTTLSTTYNAADDSLTALIDIASNATAGARDVIVTNVGQPSRTGTKSAGFTVNPAPVLTEVSPTSVGQGASVPFTLTGTGFQDGLTVAVNGANGVTATVSSVTATAISGTLTVADDAATTVARTFTIANPDGGATTPADKTLAVTEKPVVTDISPGYGKPGDTLTGVVLTGTGFVAPDGMGDAATPGTSFTIGGVTLSNVTYVDGTKVTADFAIAAGAPVGKRSVFVANADGGKSTFVDPGFLVATVPVAPSTVTVTAGEGTAKVDWTFPTADGSDGGSPLTGFVVDDGDSTTSNMQMVTADKRTASITGLTAGRTYTFTVSASNKVGNGPARTANGTPYGKPLAPGNVRAVATASSITVTWDAANAQGSPILDYTVEPVPASSAIPPKTVAANQPRSATFTGLAPGTTYTFTVKARNVAGDSPTSAAVSATPKYGSRLTSTRSPATPLAGQTVRYSGRLLRSDNVAIGNATVSVVLTPDIGNSRTVRVTTGSDGAWTFTSVPTYNTTVTATYDGASDVARASASYKMLVLTRITITSPRSGSTTAASSTLPIKGTTSPNKAGRIVYLKRGSAVLARATVAGNGAFTFNTKLARGTYTLYVAIGTTSGNAGANSSSFVVRRS